MTTLGRLRCWLGFHRFRPSGTPWVFGCTRCGIEVA